MAATSAVPAAMLARLRAWLPLSVTLPKKPPAPPEAKAASPRRCRPVSDSASLMTARAPRSASRLVAGEVAGTITKLLWPSAVQPGTEYWGAATSRNRPR